jgi:uncharacterized protein YkwD
MSAASSYTAAVSPRTTFPPRLFASRSVALHNDQTMRKLAKRYLIPHEANEYKPHILRERAVLSIVAIAIVLFVGSTTVSKVIQHTKLGAAIYTSLLVDLANQDRTTQGLSKLAPNPLLAQAAGMKAADMSAKGYFAHESPDGRKPWDWISGAGYTFLYAGENLAIDFVNSEDVETAWMNSPGHRANLLNQYFTEVGIATAEGAYQGHPTTFVVQMFGRPLTKTTAAATVTNTTRTPEAAAAATTSSATPAPRTTDRAELARSPIVKGEATTVPSSTPPSIKTLVEDPTFIAVRREPPASVSRSSEAAATPAATSEATSTDSQVAQATSTILGSMGATPLQPPHIFGWEKLLVNPGPTLRIIYGTIAALVFVVLVLMIIEEFRIRHPKNVAYGLLLIAVTLVLMYLSTATPLSSIKIV